MISIGQFFVRVNTRQVFSAYGGTGVPADPWKCSAIGDEGPMFPVVQADLDAFGIFEMQATPNPAGFSPSGDVVDFRANAVGFNQYGSLPPAPLTLTTKRAILAGWLAYVLAPQFKLAVITIPDPNGTDRYLYALEEELTLVQKNPVFP